MDIAIHIGANCTEVERLLRSLLRNADALAKRGVAVPGPGRYRNLLREAVLARARGEGAEGVRDVLLDAMLDEREVERTVLANPAFMALPSRVFDGGVFYGTAPGKLRALSEIFEGDRVEAHLSIRNPATWLPAVLGQAQGKGLEALLGGADPLHLRWADLVQRLRRAAPDVPLTIWCNEDAPLLWGEAMARLAGLGPEDPLEGRHDLLSAIMAPEGGERFRAYMDEHPGQTPVQERRVIGAFLDKFALRSEVEQEVDLPGWDDEIVDLVTRAYEAEVATLGDIPGVTLVQP